MHIDTFMYIHVYICMCLHMYTYIYKKNLQIFENVKNPLAFASKSIQPATPRQQEYVASSKSCDHRFVERLLS